MKITTSLQDILTVKKQLVYVPSDDYVCSIWTPKLHIINGVPYIYVTMAKEVRGTQHLFVLTNDSGLIAGPYKKNAYLRHEEAPAQSRRSTASFITFIPPNAVDV